MDGNIRKQQHYLMSCFHMNTEETLRIPGTKSTLHSRKGLAFFGGVPNLSMLWDTYSKEICWNLSKLTHNIINIVYSFTCQSVFSYGQKQGDTKFNEI